MPNDITSVYPELPETGAVEAQVLIDRFKVQLAKAAEEAISDLYVDIIPHIESDSWGNYRNCLMDGLRDYHNRPKWLEYDFRAIRAALLVEHREEIIADLNQDHLARIAELEARILELQRSRY